MKRIFLLLFLVLSLPGQALWANVPKDTANYYLLEPSRYLGKRVRLWIESVTLSSSSPVDGYALFRAPSWHGTELHGYAEILVPQRNARRFADRYTQEDGYEQTDSIGTRSNEGWRGRRGSFFFVQIDGRYYFSETRDPTGHTGATARSQATGAQTVSLTDLEGRTIEAILVDLDQFEVSFRRPGNERIYHVRLSNLDGDTQRTLVNILRQSRR